MSENQENTNRLRPATKRRQHINACLISMGIALMSLYQSGILGPDAAESFAYAFSLLGAASFLAAYLTDWQPSWGEPADE